VRGVCGEAEGQDEAIRRGVRGVGMVKVAAVKERVG